MRQRTSPIWKLAQQDFAELVAKHCTYAAVLAEFGLPNRGNNFKTLKKRIREDGVSDAHIQARKVLQRHICLREPAPLEHLLSSKARLSGTKLKRRLIKEGLLHDQCSACGVGTRWNGRKLRLQLDHEDGDPTNNTLSNLRVLCPNCHSQTPTFTNRNRVEVRCTYCSEVILVRRDQMGVGKLKFCGRACVGKFYGSSHGVKWPAPEELRDLVWSSPVVRLVAVLGVSGPAIKKRCKKLGIATPPRGYWAKIQAEQSKS